MLKFKNTQSLSRAEMKNLTGGVNNVLKPLCAVLCRVDGDCAIGQNCESFPCVLNGQPTLGFKCAYPS